MISPTFSSAPAFELLCNLCPYPKLYPFSTDITILLALPQGPSSPGPSQSKLLPTVACPPCALAVSFPGRLCWQGEATRAVCHGVILGAETVQLIRWHWLACAGAERAGIWRGFTICVCVCDFLRVHLAGSYQGLALPDDRYEGGGGRETWEAKRKKYN